MSTLGWENYERCAYDYLQNEECKINNVRFKRIFLSWDTSEVTRGACPANDELMRCCGRAVGGIEILEGGRTKYLYDAFQPWL